MSGKQKKVTYLYHKDAICGRNPTEHNLAQVVECLAVKLENKNDPWT